jgi:hypothetical protein
MGQQMRPLLVGFSVRKPPWKIVNLELAKGWSNGFENCTNL